MRFEDKVVLVTGSSRNTGLGIAAAFLREGAFVFVNGSTAESTRSGAEKLRAAGFDRLAEVPANLTVAGEIDALFAQIIKKAGRLDILVNNAVVQCCGYSFEDLPSDELEKTLATNLLGTIRVSQRAVGIMRNQPEKGVIINFGSNVSTRAIRNRTAYCASKGGIDALTRSMAIDLAPFGIRVNAVAPGYIYTDRWDVLPPETAERRRKNIPLGREADAETIARVVMFFASDDSRGVTGERLVVDGGCSAQHMPADVDV